MGIKLQLYYRLKKVEKRASTEEQRKPNGKKSAIHKGGWVGEMKVMTISSSR
jgi:hypothetical protein